MADTLSWRIEQFEIDRNLPYIDSVLMVKTEEFEVQKNCSVLRKMTNTKMSATFIKVKKQRQMSIETT